MLQTALENSNKEQRPYLKWEKPVKEEENAAFNQVL
jgi:hypothetical protein